MISAGGQRRVLGEVLEMCPGNKILWSCTSFLVIIFMSCFLLLMDYVLFLVGVGV